MKFLDYVSRWKTEARIGVGDGWKLCQDQIIAAHIAPFIGCLNIIDITPSHISEIINASVTKGHAPNTTKKIYMVLSKIFNDAKEFFEVLEKNPVKKRFHRVKTPNIVQPALGWEQSWILLEYVMNDPRYGVPIWLQTLAGLRISEVQSLTWSDVNMAANSILVRSCYNKHTKKIQPFPKGKEHITVPMPPTLKKYLIPRMKGSGFVCTSASGGMFSREYYKVYLKNIFTRLKLPIKSSHGLRHSCARIYADLGATNDELQIILGHKSLQKTYIHRDDTKVWELSKMIK